MTWAFEDAVYNTGETINGYFTYNENLGAYGTFSDINVTATQDGNTVVYNDIYSVSGGNSKFLSFIANTVGDLTGTPLTALTLAQPMTALGGSIDISPGPDNLSSQGFCYDSGCTTTTGPYDQLQSAASFPLNKIQ